MKVHNLSVHQGKSTSLLPDSLSGPDSGLSFFLLLHLIIKGGVSVLEVRLEFYSNCLPSGVLKSFCNILILLLLLLLTTMRCGNRESDCQIQDNPSSNILENKIQ